MKILFIGGTGIISEAVSRFVIESGNELYLLNRGNRLEFVPYGAKLINGDIRDTENCKEILKDHFFDVVVNWIAFTPEHVQNDVEVFSGNTNQYIFISSASAYQKPPCNYIVTESTPLYNPYWQYSRDKIACEDLLIHEYRNNHFPITIVRPSLTYGNAMIPAALNSWLHPWSLVDRMKKGKKIIVHGDGTSLWTMTHNEDFARGFIGLIGNTKAIGHAFHITSDEVLSWNQIYRSIGDAVDIEPNIIHIPTDFIVSISPDHQGTLLGDKSVSVVFDNSKIKQFVPNYVPSIPFDKGIKKTTAFFLSHPEKCSVDENWDHLMDQIILKYECNT
jgi:nucleoside-diphosphate-sugar epimerase